jgi:ABC-2 type transport system permease protein
MRILLNIIRKEFIQIFRNRVMLPFIFLAPILQMVILVFAANLEMQEIKFYVVDQDLSSVSRRLVSKFTGSEFYSYRGSGFNIEVAEDMLIAEEADVIIHIPANFENVLRTEPYSSVQLLINAVNSTKAGLINAYTHAIITGFNREIRMEWTGVNTAGLSRQIDMNTSFWFNPELNYKIYMLPGILVILVTIIGMFLAALNLVREKELGTSEQINVTPIRKYHFIFAKLFPFWVIALFELAFGLTIGRIFFDLPILGSLWLLFAFAGVYLLVVLGIGLFLSTISSNQQQVMFMTFFFMLTFILMSGIFTPVESMPDWAQRVNVINPYAYFMKVIRMILLKGSGFSAIKTELLAMSVYAMAILSLAVWRYRKVS